MKLFYSAASPFVRKVLIVAHERGLFHRLELVSAPTTPVAPNAGILTHNPSGKMPTLVLDDGEALFDSRVIVEYLDGIGSGPRLGGVREALVLQALADSITDAAVLLRYETFLRPEALRWPEWIDGQWQKVVRGLDVLESRGLEGLDIGVVATACALGYLDFRFADRPWRDARPRLAAWYATFAERPSMRATQPA